MLPELGIIEGFYGKPWSWEERAAMVSFAADNGYQFYLYAPKGDPFLRKRWHAPYPEATAGRLAALAAHCRSVGVRFGVGLSPYEIFRSFDQGVREALQAKLRALDEVGVQELAVLFDDMRGDLPELAERQAEIVHWVGERTGAERLIVCPTYYTDDPVLDRVFGARPEGYLESLGALLDPAIQVFWTGEEVCARELSPGHLARVSQQLRRPPLLWDNYPVNDGARMSQYLHLRGFTGRRAGIGEQVSGHGVNPALQPTLSRIPLLTLLDSYRLGDGYQYMEATRSAATAVLGEELGGLVYDDLLQLQEVGLDRLEDKEPALRERYTGVDHPGAREIVAWLDGEYRITDDMLEVE